MPTQSRHGTLIFYVNGIKVSDFVVASALNSQRELTTDCCMSSKLRMFRPILELATSQCMGLSGTTGSALDSRSEGRGFNSH